MVIKKSVVRKQCMRCGSSSLTFRYTTQGDTATGFSLAEEVKNDNNVS